MTDSPDSETDYYFCKFPTIVFILGPGALELNSNAINLLNFLIFAQRGNGSSYYSHRRIAKALDWGVTTKGECRILTKTIELLKPLGLVTWLDTEDKTRTKKHYDIRPVLAFLAKKEKEYERMKKLSKTLSKEELKKARNNPFYIDMTEFNMLTKKLDLV